MLLHSCLSFLLYLLSVPSLLGMWQWRYCDYVDIGGHLHGHSLATDTYVISAAPALIDWATFTSVYIRSGEVQTSLLQLVVLAGRVDMIFSEQIFCLAYTKKGGENTLSERKKEKEFAGLDLNDD